MNGFVETVNENVIKTYKKKISFIRKLILNLKQKLK